MGVDHPIFATSLPSWKLHHVKVIKKYHKVRGISGVGKHLGEPRMPEKALHTVRPCMTLLALFMLIP